MFPDTRFPVRRPRLSEGTVERMMIWINGTFGVGKTTAGTALVDALPALRLFDPEVVGYMLAHSLKDQSFTDFQDLPAWRTLVPAVATEIRRHTGQDLVAVQTVLRQEYWAELTATFGDLGERIFHVVLDAGRADPSEPDRARSAGVGGPAVEAGPYFPVHSGPGMDDH